MVQYGYNELNRLSSSPKFKITKIKICMTQAPINIRRRRRKRKKKKEKGKKGKK
jgi:hypothetical protein